MYTQGDSPQKDIVDIDYEKSECDTEILYFAVRTVPEKPKMRKTGTTAKQRLGKLLKIHKMF